MTTELARILHQKSRAYIACTVTSTTGHTSVRWDLKGTPVSSLRKPNYRQGTTIAMHLENQPCNYCIWAYTFRGSIKRSCNENPEKCRCFVQAKYEALLDPRLSTPREVYKDGYIRKKR